MTEEEVRLYVICELLRSGKQDDVKCLIKSAKLIVDFVLSRARDDKEIFGSDKSSKKGMYIRGTSYR